MGRQRAGKTRHDSAQLIQVRLTHIPPHLIRPRVLWIVLKVRRPRDVMRTKLRPLMQGVVHVLRKPISVEQIGHPLNALASQAQLPRDLGDGRRLSLNHLERKPTS